MRSIWNFKDGPIGGVIPNIGDFGGTAMDLVPFVTTGINYNSTDKCVRTTGATGSSTLRTQNTTNIFDKSWGVRCIFKYYTDNYTIFGTEVASDATPLRIRLSDSLWYIGAESTTISPEFCDGTGATINDITFWFEYITDDTTACTVKNNKTGEQYTRESTYVTKNKLKNGAVAGLSTDTMLHLYFGTANYNGSNSIPAQIDWYTAIFAKENIVELFLNKYFLKKDGIYKIIDSNGQLIELGNDLSTIKVSGNNTIKNEYTQYLIDHTLIVCDDCLNETNVTYDYRNKLSLDDTINPSSTIDGDNVFDLTNIIPDNIVHIDVGVK